jgi:hypothetical protein
MFRWLNKQGVESDAGFAVQRTGRFTCEYREAGCTIELEVESGLVDGKPCINVARDAFARWSGPCIGSETSLEQRARLMRNLEEAMAFQGLAVVVN